MVHFNRFNQGGKIDDEIGGSATLSIQGRVYHLTGILVHDGPSANSGHYFCDVISPPYSQTGVAYRCNDSDYPEQISNEMVGTSFKTAYMQIYVLSDELTTVPPTMSIATTAPSNDLDELATLIAQRDSILSIPPSQRTSGDNNRKRKINEKIRKLAPKKPALTSAEKKRAQRQNETKRAEERTSNTERKRALRQDEERRKKERTANTERMKAQRQDEERRKKEQTANTERMKAQRQDEERRKKERTANTERKKAQRQDETKRKQERADDRMRRTAKRAHVAINPRAGLNSELVLSGHFKVEKNFLGFMDKVKSQKIITTYYGFFPRCVQSAEHVISQRRLVPECAACLARWSCHA